MNFTTGKAPTPKSSGGGGRPHSDMRLAIAALTIGDDYVEVLLANTGRATLDGLQASVLCLARRALGKGNYATRQNPDRTGVRIWRTA